jgi:hypothetical protein
MDCAQDSCASLSLIINELIKHLHHVSPTLHLRWSPRNMWRKWETRHKYISFSSFQLFSSKCRAFLHHSLISQCCDVVRNPMKAYGGMDVHIRVFFTSALLGGKCSTSRPGRFTSGERAPGTHWIGGWVDLRAGLDDVEKILAPTETPNRSRDNLVGIVTSYGLDDRGGLSSGPGGVKNFLLSRSSRPALRCTQPPIQWVPGTLFPGVKRPGREVDHSPPTSAEVKKMWIYTSTPPYAFMA